jgi:NADPH:quinone reductase-like Zn-dependent oxidoreductase
MASGPPCHDRGVEDFVALPLHLLLDQLAAGGLPVQLGRVFVLDEIVAAHRLKESNQAHGKIVIWTASG